MSDWIWIYLLLSDPHTAFNIGFMGKIIIYVLPGPPQPGSTEIKTKWQNETDDLFIRFILFLLKIPVVQLGGYFLVFCIELYLCYLHIGST